MTRAALRTRAKRQLDASGMSLRKFAASIGLSTAAALCQFMKHGTEPLPSVVSALGYRRVDREEYREEK